MLCIVSCLVGKWIYYLKIRGEIFEREVVIVLELLEWSFRKFYRMGRILGICSGEVEEKFVKEIEKE